MELIESTVREILDFLNKNSSLLNVVGWLTVFLLGLYTQRKYINTNFKIEYYNKYVELEKKILNMDLFSDIDRHNFQLDLIAVVGKIRMDSSEKAVEFRKKLPEIWKIYIEKERKYFAKFHLQLTDLQKHIDDIELIESKAEKVISILSKHIGDVEIAQLSFIQSLDDKNPLLDQDLDELSKLALEADSKTYSFISRELSEIRLEIRKLLLGNAFSTKRARRRKTWNVSVAFSIPSENEAKPREGMNN